MTERDQSGERKQRQEVLPVSQVNRVEIARALFPEFFTISDLAKGKKRPQKRRWAIQGQRVPH